MKTAEIRALLRDLSFLEGLTEGDFHFLGKQLQPVEFQPGEAIFSEGMERVRMCIIYSGTVAIEKHSAGGDAPAVRLATLGRGEAIGEGVLLDDTPHGTSAVAIEETKALQLLKTQVQDLLRERPSVFAALVGSAARTISQRLRATDATLVGRGRSLGFGSGGSRTEKDLLGERDVPKEALYGIQTLRALENFPISGTPLREFPALINALSMVKEAAARANAELGLLDETVANAISGAAHEIRQGRHHEHFLVDMIQGGAGTSTNMNANEVIANRACELLGRARGEYAAVNPHGHVNLHQSTNDVYPTAIKIALHLSIEDLRAAMRSLASAFLRKGEEFAEVLKMGRTQLQDAVPMTLGQEFRAFGVTILEDVDRLGEAQALIREINMGATAIGTGLNAPVGYSEAIRRHLAEVSGLDLITAPDLVEATADTGAFVQLSGVLKRCAVKLSKICNDLRLLSSGPRTGLGEINLPPRQPGSSIMPGKVNPVIPEVVNQVCFEIIGGDVTVTMAAEAGQLQLNVFEPVIAYRLLHGIDILRNACHVLEHRCVDGITANVERMRGYVESSIGVVTALVPMIGYDAASQVARDAASSGRGVYEIVLERELLTKEQLDEALHPERMVGSSAARVG
jgi:aspartate ammonia-lyase